MTLFIKRFKKIDEGTIGEFRLKDGAGNSLLSGYTLEPMGEDTIKREQDRRIPAGLYSVAWHNSPKFKRTLHLLYNDLVPKDRCILIHAGNFPKHTEGCILLGATYDKKGIYKSKITLDRFLNLLKNRELKVKIENLKEVL